MVRVTQINPDGTSSPVDRASAASVLGIAKTLVNSLTFETAAAKELGNKDAKNAIQACRDSIGQALDQLGPTAPLPQTANRLPLGSLRNFGTADTPAPTLNNPPPAQKIAVQTPPPNRGMSMGA